MTRASHEVTHVQPTLFDVEASAALTPSETTLPETTLQPVLADAELNAEWHARRAELDAERRAQFDLGHTGLQGVVPSQQEQVANARRAERQNPSHSQILDRSK